MQWLFSPEEFVGGQVHVKLHDEPQGDREVLLDLGRILPNLARTRTSLGDFDRTWPAVRPMFGQRSSRSWGNAKAYISARFGPTSGKADSRPGPTNFGRCCPNFGQPRAGFAPNSGNRPIAHELGRISHDSGRCSARFYHICAISRHNIILSACVLAAAFVPDHTSNTCRVSGEVSLDEFGGMLDQRS